MTDTPSKTPTRRPDCVTQLRMGNTVLTVSGYFKQDTNRHRRRQNGRKSWRPKAAARPAPARDLLPVVPR